MDRIDSGGRSAIVAPAMDGECPGALVRLPGMRETEPRKHGALPRGQDAISASLPETGRFGRMFPEGPRCVHEEKHLRLLAETMIAQKEPDKDLGVEDPDENREIPAGYTYLGQFIDHDITFDPASSLQRQNDPRALVDFRTPRFDLDSIYGRGPADDPYLYVPNDTIAVHDGTLTIGPGLKFLLENAADSSAVDLPRNRVSTADGTCVPGRALIGDPRNDENLIISQLHRTFLQFHNAVVDRLLREEVTKKKQSLEAVQKQLTDTDLPDELFLRAQRFVRWHYQWIIVHDFLRKICREGIVEEILGRVLAGAGPLLMFSPPAGEPEMPVEFSAAAYRFGHSMVRPGYFINDEVREQNRKRADGQLRTPIVGEQAPDGLQSLTGFRPLPAAATIQWKYFFDGFGGTEPDNLSLPQLSYKIDAELAHPLGHLPTGIASTGPVSLAERNLLRGQSLGLPSGQWVARAMGLDPLSDAQLELTQKGLTQRVKNAETGATDDAIAAAAEAFKGNAPLWYYILKEAEHAGGLRLGEVGSRIVAGVIIGLLAADPNSYLRSKPNWEPELSRNIKSFGISDLIRFATAQPSNRLQIGGTMVTTLPEDATSSNGTSKPPAQDPLLEQLGRLIKRGIPYRYDESIEPVFLLESPVPINSGGPSEIEADPSRAVIDGPAKDFGDDQNGKKLPRTYQEAAKQDLTTSEQSIREDPNRSMWWYFDGKPYRVVKAFKIAYRVKDDDPSTPTGGFVKDGMVIKHILIGYMGIDPGGG